MGMPNQQYKGKTSQYKGVYYNKQTRKWIARLHLKGQTPKYGGHFNDELDAAKRVNQLCEDFGIPSHNFGISAIPDEEYKTPEFTSKYGEVSWNEKRNLSHGEFFNNRKKQKSYFNNGFDPVPCDKMGIFPQNPEIPNQQKKEKTSQYNGVYWKKQS